MGFWELLKKQFTPQKFFFNFLFWSVHWGLFAFGWSVSEGLYGVVGDRLVLTVDAGTSKRVTPGWRV